MGNNIGQLFALLEDILNTATSILTITQNQETAILHGFDHNIISELARNKQEQILKLGELEREFEGIYQKSKEQITNQEDIKRLKALVSKIIDTKERISKSEETNRRLWSNSGLLEGITLAIKKPKSYAMDQYRKYNK